MRVAVTGATGLVGSAVVPALRTAGHDVVPVARGRPATAAEIGWDPTHGTIDAVALGGCDAVIHLAGATIGRRWTTRVRDDVLRSRVDGTRLLANTLAALDRPPAVLVCASGAGYYGDRGDELLTEASAQGTGFLADVVAAWETAADPAREAGIRVVHLRQGLILSRRGGALQRLLLPFRLCVGGRVGNGRQWWSWITLDDAARVYAFVLTAPLSGPVNVAATGTVSNHDFVKALGRAVHRPTVLPLPSVAVGLLFGQMGREMLLGGQRLEPTKLLDAGFAFEHPDLESGLVASLAQTP